MFFSFTQIFAWLINFKYLLLLPLAILEGPIVTVIAGFFSSLEIFNIFTAYGVIIVGDLIGDTLYYSVGRYGRKKFIAKWGKYIGLSVERVDAMEREFKKRGKMLLIGGKISHVFGGIILVAAGIAKIKYRDFMIYNLVATLPKSIIFLLIGFYFGQAYVRIKEYFDYTVIITFGLGISCLIIYWLIKKYLERSYLDK